MICCYPWILTFHGQVQAFVIKYVYQYYLVFGEHHVLLQQKLFPLLQHLQEGIYADVRQDAQDDQVNRAFRATLRHQQRPRELLISTLFATSCFSGCVPGHTLILSSIPVLEVVDGFTHAVYDQFRLSFAAKAGRQAQHSLPAPEEISV